MFLGVISDTHDRLDKIEKAVKYFNTRKIDYVIHAGDYIAPFTAVKFSRLKAPMIGVFGNCDGEKKGLTEKFAPFAKLYEGPYEFELKGFKIALMHDPEDVDKYIKKNRIVIYGHTHKPEIKHFSEKALINPGECCGYLTGRSTVATVDTKTLKVSITDL